MYKKVKNECNRKKETGQDAADYRRVTLGHSAAQESVGKQGRGEQLFFK